MAVDEKVIERIQKLLNVKGRTEAESAQYVAKAQALLEQHDLTMAEVTGKAKSSDVLETESMDIFTRGKTDAWKGDLFNTVARTSGVWPILQWKTIPPDAKHKTYRSVRIGWFAGQPMDVELAGYAYSFLVGELNRLQKEYGDAKWAALWAEAAERFETHAEAEARAKDWGEHPLKMKSSWMMGAVETVIANLAQAAADRRRASEASTALTVDKDAAIRDYWYMKTHGKTYAEYQADLKAKMDARADADKAWLESLTPAERKAVMKERKPRKSRWRGGPRDRRYDNVNWNAYGDGQTAGAGISVRPGTGAGTRERAGAIKP